MIPDKLHIHKRPKLNNPCLLLGFSGWMDGGEVSTGTVKLLIKKLGAEKLAEIEPEGFYIHSFFMSNFTVTGGDRNQHEKKTNSKTNSRKRH